MNTINNTINNFYWCSELNIISRRSYWKTSSITSSALSLIMISMLSVFWFIACSPPLSFKDLKVVAIMFWIFGGADFLKDLRNYILRIICVWSSYLTILVYMSLHCFSFFSVLCIFCLFWVFSLISLSYRVNNIYKIIVHISAIWPSAILQHENGAIKIQFWHILKQHDYK